MQPVNLVAWRAKLISRLWRRALSTMLLLSTGLAFTILMLNNHLKTQISQQQINIKLWQQILYRFGQQQNSAEKMQYFLQEQNAKELTLIQKKHYCYQAYFWLHLLPTLPKKIWLVSAYQSEREGQVEGHSESLADINVFMTNLRTAKVVKTTKLMALNKLPDRSFQFRLSIQLKSVSPSEERKLCNLNI